MLTLSPVFRITGTVFAQFSNPLLLSALQFAMPFLWPFTRSYASNNFPELTKLVQVKIYSPADGAVKIPLWRLYAFPLLRNKPSYTTLTGVFLCKFSRFVMYALKAIGDFSGKKIKRFWDNIRSYEHINWAIVLVKFIQTYFSSTVFNTLRYFYLKNEFLITLLEFFISKIVLLVILDIKKKILIS